MERVLPEEERLKQTASPSDNGEAPDPFDVKRLRLSQDFSKELGV